MEIFRNISSRYQGIEAAIYIAIMSRTRTEIPYFCRFDAVVLQDT